MHAEGEMRLTEPILALVASGNGDVVWRVVRWI